MYDKIPIVEISEASAKETAIADRLRYERFYRAVEEFAIKHRLVLVGPVANHLLCGARSGEPHGTYDLSRSFDYAFYGVDALQRSRELADILYKLDPETLGRYTNQTTVQRNQVFSVKLDGRPMATITNLPRIQGSVQLLSAIVPIECAAQFVPGGLLLTLGPELQLVSVLTSLCSPASAGDWPDLLRVEALLRRALLAREEWAGGGLLAAEVATTPEQIDATFPEIDAGTIHGGRASERPGRDDSSPLEQLASALFSRAAGPGRVLIGAAAACLIGGASLLVPMTALSRVQYCSSDPLEREGTEAAALAGEFGLAADWTIIDPGVPMDPRLRRLTLYVEFGGRRSAVLDVFNEPTYALVPYTTLGVTIGGRRRGTRDARRPPARLDRRPTAPAVAAPKSIRIGSAFALARYNLIESWKLSVMATAGLLDKSFAARAQLALRSQYTAIAAAIMTARPEAILPGEYSGRFSDPDRAAKRAAAASGARFFPYYPRARDKKTGDSPADAAATTTGGSETGSKSIFISGGIDSAPLLVKLAAALGARRAATWEEADIIWRARYDSGNEAAPLAELHEAAAAAGRVLHLNCFPDHRRLTEKTNLVRSVEQWAAAAGVDPTDILPATVVVTWGDLRRFAAAPTTSPKLAALVARVRTLIVKPGEGFGGQNISVVPSQEFAAWCRGLPSGRSDGRDNARVVVCEYVADTATVPHLTKQYACKFDVRVNLFLDSYGAIEHFLPVRARVSDREYDVSSRDPLVHITNLDLRSELTDNSSRELNTDPHLQRYLPAIKRFVCQYVHPLLLETVYRGYRDYWRGDPAPFDFSPRPEQYNYPAFRCFQRFGIDLIIRADGSPLLLEINTNPGDVPYGPEHALHLKSFALSGIVSQANIAGAFYKYNGLHDLCRLPRCRSSQQTRPPQVYVAPALDNYDALVLILGRLHSQGLTSQIVSEWDNADIVFRFAYHPEKDHLKRGAIIDKFPRKICAALCTKTGLATALAEQFGGAAAAVAPKTFVLATGDRLPAAVIAEGYWIIKPSAGYGGEGIRLLRAGDATAAGYRAPVPVVVQEYLTNPHRGIVDRRGFYKFDLRVNFLVHAAGEIYRYRPVFVRVSDTPFDPDSANIGVHITNIHGRPATAWNARQLHEIPGLAAYSAEVDKFSAEVLSPLLRRHIVDGYRAATDLGIGPAANLGIGPATVKPFQYFGADLFLTDVGELRLLEINDVPGDAGSDIMNIWRVATAFQYHGETLPSAFGAIAQYFELMPNA